VQRLRRRLIPVRRRLANDDDARSHKEPSSPLSGSSDSEPEFKTYRSSSFGQSDSSDLISAATHSLLGAPSDECSSRAVVNEDTPIFSLQQVALICARLLKEQETKLRTEYEQVLNAKLLEQHETFVRFTNDQIHRRFEDMSISCKILLF